MAEKENEYLSNMGNAREEDSTKRVIVAKVADTEVIIQVYNAELKKEMCRACTCSKQPKQMIVEQQETTLVNVQEIRGAVHKTNLAAFGKEKLQRLLLKHKKLFSPYPGKCIHFQYEIMVDTEAPITRNHTISHSATQIKSEPR